MKKTSRKSAPVEALELKALVHLEIKDADKGEVQAVVATLGVVDHEGDIIAAGAIKSGSKVIMSAYGHDAVYGNRPAGKGKITVDGNKAIFNGRVFLDTTDGRETFSVLKAMGADQEWSFGFRVMGSEVPSEAQRKEGAYRVITKMDAFEVSPVMLGAGIGTGTISAKGAPVTPEDEPPAEEPPIEETPSAEEPPPAETPAEEKAITIDQARATLRAELKAAREIVSRLEREDANLTAKEIFQRFHRNMQRAKA